VSRTDVLVRRSIEERKTKSFRQPQLAYEKRWQRLRESKRTATGAIRAVASQNGKAPIITIVFRAPCRSTADSSRTNSAGPALRHSPIWTFPIRSNAAMDFRGL
jgi:hypothetical protein